MNTPTASHCSTRKPWHREIRPEPKLQSILRQSDCAKHDGEQNRKRDLTLLLKRSAVSLAVLRKARRESGKHDTH